MALEKWSDIIVMPDDKLKSSEIVRPFIIMQPVYDCESKKAEKE